VRLRIELPVDRPLLEGSPTSLSHGEERMIRIDVAPPGREKQVKTLKTVRGVDNPYAVSWASYNRGKDGAEGIFTQGGLALNAGKHADIIRKQGGSFALYSKKTGKVIATHKTREGALAQERAIQANKHGDAEARDPHGRWSSGAGSSVAHAALGSPLRGAPTSLKGAGKGLRVVGSGVKETAHVARKIAAAPVHVARSLARGPAKVAKGVARAARSEPAKKIGNASAKVGGAMRRVPLARGSALPGTLVKPPARHDREYSRVPSGQHGGGRFAKGGGGGGGGAPQGASGTGAVHGGGQSATPHTPPNQPVVAQPKVVALPEVPPERREKLAKDIAHHVENFGPKTSTELQEVTGASKHEVQAATQQLVKGGSHYVEGRTGRLKERVRAPNVAEGGAPPKGRWKKHLAAGLRGGLEGAAVGAGIGAAGGEVIGAIPGAIAGTVIGAATGVLSSQLEEPSLAKTAAPITKQAVSEANRRHKEKMQAETQAPKPKAPPTPKAAPVKLSPPAKPPLAPATPPKTPPHMNSADR
jgi:hypothetical protein